MERPMIIAFDFDGTLCEDEFPSIGPPKWENMNMVIEAKLLGCKTILWTCRINQALEEAISWCHMHGLCFDAINDNIKENITQYGTNPRKVFADLYVDDKFYNFNENIKEEIKKWKREK